MKHLLPIVAALALVVGVGMLVYGFRGGDFRSCNYDRFGRATGCEGLRADSVMAIGAMLATAGALGLYYRPR